MSYYSAYDNCSFPYNAQPQRFDLFCEPFSEHSLQQPPSYFQPYYEQPPWNHYDASEQEEFQSVHPWQTQFCDQRQERIPTSEIQGMTTQVAQLIVVVNYLTWKAKEENEATPLGALVAIEFQCFESQITSATASSTSQFYKDADQP
ncbi:hypothetical protein V8G54_001092 [Vigna mungo]|uniref:Uncharacterized protein n=1 Tax=Vigna mungo TaxID=3915 RepID=A0AAQ3SAN5_VIGMU